MEHKIFFNYLSNKIKTNILLLFIILPLLLSENILRQLNDESNQNEIRLTIEGINLNFLSDEFNEIPTEVLLNDIKVAFKERKILNEYDNIRYINNVTIKWNRTFTNCSYMFYNLTNVTYIDLTNFNFSEVTNTAMMFANCQNLQRIIFPDNIIITNIQNMRGMFYNCINLKSLDLSIFKTLRVENFDSMFRGCTSLTSLDLTNFNLVRAVRLDSMFYDCHSLAYLDISTFDTSNVQYMNSMFRGCISLTSIDLSHFNTGRVYSFSNMFESCTSLQQININNFDISQTCYMRSMFQNCHKLTSIDFSKFKSSKNILFGINDMFRNCSSLSVINLSNFNLTQFNSDYYEFDFSNLFTGINKNGELIYTEGLIPNKIKNIFPSEWKIIKSN